RRLLDAAEFDLIVAVRVRNALGVIQLHDEGNPVRIAPRDRPEHAERRGHRIAATLDGELDDVFRIEVRGVRRERRATGMLDALVDGQYRHVARAREAARFEEPLETTKHARRTIRWRQDAVDEVGARQVKVVLRDGTALMRQQRCVAAQQLLDSAHRSRCGNTTHCGHVPPPTGNPTTGNSKSSTDAPAAAFSTISSIGSARSAASTCSSRPRASGWRGVAPAAETWSGAIACWCAPR